LSIPEFSVKKPVTITMLIGIVIVLGVYSLNNIGLDLLPDITFPTVSVMTTWGGAAPEDVENQLTKPLEEVLSMISRVKSVKSFTREGMSIIMIEFEWGTNLDFAAQDIRDQIGIFKQYLPHDVSDPIVFKFDVSMMPLAMYSFAGDIEFNRLHEIAENIIKTRLERVDGVASISIWGWLEKEIHVLLNPTKISALGIDPQQIQMALSLNNVNLPAGYLVKRNKEYLLRTYGEFRTIDEIGNIIVGMTKNYEPIYLSNIAEIRYGTEEPRGITEVEGKKALWIMISKESGANTVNVMRRVIKEQEKLEKIIPRETKLYTMFDMSEMIRMIISKTSINGIVGALLAMLFIFLFLRSWRPTAAIIVAIPLSIIATFIAIYAAGYTLNIMTMVGLMLGVGMLVDNAIVVIENIYRKIEEGKNRIEAAGQGATQVGMAITASTLTTCAVFFPVLFIPGITGQLSSGLALTIAFALLASLFVALTIVPVIASLIFKKKKQVGMEESRWFKTTQRFYVRLLSWSLDHKSLVLLLIAMLFIGSIALYPLIGGEFMPKEDQPFAQVFFALPQGTEMEQTIAVGKQLLTVIEEDPDVLFTGLLVGVTSGSEFDLSMGNTGTPTNVNEGSIFLRLKFKEDRDQSSEQVTNKLREAFPQMNNSKFVVQDMSSQMFGGAVSGDISIKLFGDDLDELRRLANLTAKEIQKIDGTSDIEVSHRQGRPEMRIIVNRDKCARIGLAPAQVSNAIKTYTIGTFAGRFNDPGEQLDIIIKLDKKDRMNLSQIMSLPIITQTGSVVPLSQVAEMVEVIGPTEIQREEQKRTVAIGITVSEGYNLRHITQKVKVKMNELYNSLEWEQDYVYEIGGQAELMKDLYGWMIIAVIVAFLLVYMVMASQFESFLHPFVIMFTQPLFIIGVFWALFLTGTTLSLPSLMGLVILAGIVVNNGIVMVDFINQLRRKEGIAMRDAILKAGEFRLRPVLITAFTTIIGMLPMALSQSQGAEMRSPMAIAVIGGLTSATFLTLIVIPVIYSMFERLSIRARSGAKKLFGIDEEELYAEE